VRRRIREKKMQTTEYLLEDLTSVFSVYKRFLCGELTQQFGVV
jgi:hypothetical protein